MINSKEGFLEKYGIKINYRITSYKIEGEENSSLIIESKILDEYFHFERFIYEEDVNEILDRYLRFLDILSSIKKGETEIYKNIFSKGDFTKEQYKIIVEYLLKE